MLEVRFLTVIVALAACVSPTSKVPRTVAPQAPQAFKPSEVRQPALFVRLEVDSAGLDDRSRATLTSEYEGALLEALNAKAVLTKDVRVVLPGERFDQRVGLTRARDVGADYAIIVEVRVASRQIDFCPRTRRPFRAATTIWSQSVEVLRTSDGSTRLAIPKPGFEVADLEPACDDPRSSERQPRSEIINRAVGQLLFRVLGP